MDAAVGRNLIDSESGAMRGKGYLILDRDTKYTDQFRRLIRGSGTNVIRLPPRSPNLNAYAERWILSAKQECLAKLILFGEGSLRRALRAFIDHFHTERNHQGKSNVLLFSSDVATRRLHNRAVFCRERLGGLLKYYCGAA